MIPDNPQGMQKQTGMTLVEMIAAMMVGLLLAAILSELLFKNSRIASHQQSSLKKEMLLRQVSETIGHSVRNAGYLGCSGALPRPYPRLLEQPVRGQQIAGNSHLLQLSGMEVVETATVEKGFFISNCNHLIQADNKQKQSVTADVQLLRPFKHAFFLRQDGLWQRELNGSEQLIGPGIEEFYVQYGLEEGPIDAADIEAAKAWARVTGIQLQLGLHAKEGADAVSHNAYFSLRNRLP